MRRLLIIFFLALIANTARATHLMGGDLVATSDTSGTYTLTLTLYRDTLGIPLATSEIIDLYIYDAVNNVYVSAGASLTAPLDPVLSTALLPSFPYGVEVGVYTTTVTLTPGKYRFVNMTCCRNGAILNAATPLAESMVIRTDLEVDANLNSTPGCLALPVAYFPVNVPSTYNPLPYDPDGDSISWNLNVPIGYYEYDMPTAAFTFTDVLGFAAPAADPAGPFTMNPVTGEISWTPDTVGNFIQSFIVNEYKNGVQVGSMVRDMQYVVIPGNGNSSPFFVPVTPYNTNTSQNYYYAYYTPGQLFSFQIEGTDLDQSTLQMEAYSELFQNNNPAVFNTNVIGTDIVGTLQWTPASTYNKDVTVVFRLRDGMFTQDFTLLLKKNPNPNSVTTISSNISNVTAYPNPAHHELNVLLQLDKNVDNASVTLYNPLGQKISELYNGKLMKGNITLNHPINLAPGIYYLNVRENGTTVKTINVSVQ